MIRTVIHNSNERPLFWQLYHPAGYENLVFLLNAQKRWAFVVFFLRCPQSSRCSSQIKQNANLASRSCHPSIRSILPLARAILFPLPHLHAPCVSWTCPPTLRWPFLFVTATAFAHRVDESWGRTLIGLDSASPHLGMPHITEKRLVWFRQLYSISLWRFQLATFV